MSRSEQRLHRTGNSAGTSWRYAWLGLLGIVTVFLGTIFIFN